MSKRGHKTMASELKRGFASTHWTEIFDARSEDEPQRQAALGQLLGRYWKPVYFYLRSKGSDREDAKDLTQGFFHEVVLGRSLIQRADPAKGRFRTFLLTALDRFAANIHRGQRTKQRMPEGGMVSLEGIDWRSVPEPVHSATPIEVFDYSWASALLDQVLAQVAGQCLETGNATHWELFRERVLQPIMANAESPSLDLLCEKHGISKNAKASKMILKVKRLFRAVLRRHVRQFVESDPEVDDEIRHLLKIFSGSGAAS